MPSLSAIFRQYFTIRLLNEYQIHFLLHVYGERKVAVLKKLHTVKYSELQKSYFSFKSMKAICWWKCFLFLEELVKKSFQTSNCSSDAQPFSRKNRKKPTQNLSTRGGLNVWVGCFLGFLQRISIH